MDAGGHLVGVVSQSDLVKSDAKPKGRIVPLATNQHEGVDEEDEVSPFYSHLDGSDIEELRDGFLEEDYGDATVADIFTPYTVTAAIDTPVSELARLMVDKDVHRLIILEGRKVVGIVTSMDILRSYSRPRRSSPAPRLVAH